MSAADRAGFSVTGLWDFGFNLAHGVRLEALEPSQLVVQVKAADLPCLLNPPH
jgi:hypothetical protein